MPRYLVERHVPGAAGFTHEQLLEITEKSLCAMEHLRDYRWLHTYIAGDRLLCIHEAPSEDIVWEHSRRGGFPVTSITEVSSVFGPEIASSVDSA